MRTKPPHLHASPVCAVKTMATSFTKQFFLVTIQIGPQINHNIAMLEDRNEFKFWLLCLHGIVHTVTRNNDAL